ncbi:unnamed protein product [Caenorhabditis bovis]|uniref:Uncharacterized protein n=1 Tax=Caenorhabditis bovis TaxID=2654633 RepID=A0A8S1E3X0_9PELO|nr:unnamed protein product [Caenorhabditis bovis]CAB3398314.1 unnamed protein product [Caenorhabditis bovis]CAB3398315.1 unnamed protein product [Caenorhabditis bovis]
MLLRIFALLCLVAGVSTVTVTACETFCSYVNGGPSNNYCSPFKSFAAETNRTCFNKCVMNCLTLGGTCRTDPIYKCCLKTTPKKNGNNEFQKSGCNRLYDFILD